MGDPRARARRARRLVAGRHPAQSHAGRAPPLPGGRSRPAGVRAEGVRRGPREAGDDVRGDELAHALGRGAPALGRRARGHERAAAPLPRDRAVAGRPGGRRGVVRLAGPARPVHARRRTRGRRRRGVPAPRGRGCRPEAPPLALPGERHARPARVRGPVRRPRGRRGEGAVPARARVARARRDARLVAARTEDRAGSAHRARGDRPAGPRAGSALRAPRRSRGRRRAARPGRGLASSAGAPAGGRAAPPRREPVASRGRDRLPLPRRAHARPSRPTSSSASRAPSAPAPSCPRGTGRSRPAGAGRRSSPSALPARCRARRCGS